MILFADILHGQSATAFTIQGYVKGSGVNHIILSYSDHFSKRIKDTAKIANGKFIFSGFVAEPTLASLHVTNMYVDDPHFAEMYLEGGNMVVKLDARDFKKIEVEGSKTQQQTAGLNVKKRAIQKQIKKFIDKANSADSATADKCFREVELLYKKLDELDLNFITNNPDSYASAVRLFYKIETLDFETFKRMYALLDPTVKASRWGKNIQKEIEKKSSSILGAKAPDFRIRDANGNYAQLSEINRGRYVLLDFWATWCVPCREAFPSMRKLYDDYGPLGFEIISISQDLDTSAWRKAIVTDSIDEWRHVLIAENLAETFKGITNDEDIIEKYYINGIPLQILINQEGIIIGRWTGQSVEQEEELRRLLQRVFRQTNL